MEHCKDVSVRREVGGVTRAFGHINEWGLAYVERFRNSDCAYIGPVETTICALIMHEKNGAMSPVYRQWLGWEAGNSTHLKFGWITDCQVDIKKCDPPKWYYEGQEVIPRDLANAKNFEAAKSVRMTCAGLPGLATMALRSHLLSKAFQVKNFLSNEPTLWVPRGKLEDDAVLVENFLRYLCSGIGLKRAPFYYQARNLTMEHYKVSPWDMYRNAGCRAEVMMSDFGKTKNLLAQLILIIRKFKANPIEMCGFTENELYSWLTAEQRKRFNNCVPWWFISDEDYEVPSFKDCFVTARRADTMLAASKSSIAVEQMGFSTLTCEDIRHKMHRVETPPQKAPVLTEVKPEPIVVNPPAAPTAAESGSNQMS